MCLAALATIANIETRPVFEIEGRIESVRIIHGNSRHYSAYIYIRTPSGDQITLHSSDDSPFFRAGEHVRVKYLGDADELLKASFFGSNGQQEGVLNGTTTWLPFGLLLVGLFLIWAAFKKYRRDPEGAED